jgi:hypothetical protein
MEFGVVNWFIHHPMSAVIGWPGAFRRRLDEREAITRLDVFPLTGMQSGKKGG